jgi:demethylmenaquinone methyltransferase/2-methoxy-6-polyprenyl-1,4-benzoquinol methylase
MLLDYWGYNTISFFAPNTSYASQSEYNKEGVELKYMIKTLKDNGIEGVSFEQADCLNMHFADSTFHAVTVAFGVRNFEDLQQGYRQMYRVMRPGGMLCVVELSTPRNRFIRWFYDIYTLRIIPAIGALKSGDRSAYRYLPLSIAAVPQGDDMLALMRNAGFSQCNVKRLTLGTCSIYTAVK